MLDVSSCRVPSLLYLVLFFLLLWLLLFGYLGVVTAGSSVKQPRDKSSELMDGKPLSS